MALLNRKVIINLLSCFIPSSTKRKQFRSRYLSKFEQNSSVIDYGTGNSIILVCKNNSIRKNIEIPGLQVKFYGNNSTLTVHESVNFSNCTISLGHNASFDIKASKYPVKNLAITKFNSSKIEIGKNFSCISCRIENHDEPNLNISIGDDCQFSHGILLRTSDGHSIYDIHTKQLINKPVSGITIGNHVWLGMNSTIIKEALISDNSIVGASSLVNKQFNESNVIIAGMPAKIIKRDINWDRSNTIEYEQKQAQTFV